MNFDSKNIKQLRGKLTERIKRTPSIESFRFITDEKLDFTPGQFIQVIFDENNLSNKELNKYLSFSSSPSRQYFEVTKRLSQSKFSEKLSRLSIGSQVLFKAPMGSCVFREDYGRIGFLIGGIGITPVISIIEFIAERGLNTDVVLLYSNRTEEEIAFLKELNEWQKANTNIKVVYTVTDCKPKDAICIEGRINKSIFLDNFKEPGQRVFFIFGPPKMVEAMESLCLEAGVLLDNLKTESFVGY